MLMVPDNTDQVRQIAPILKRTTNRIYNSQSGHSLTGSRLPKQQGIQSRGEDNENREKQQTELEAKMATTRHEHCEWNEDKRSSTLLKHGIDFLDAVRLFDGRAVLHVPSNHPGEERWIATGMLSGRMVSEIYTLRSDLIRIITARRARKNEERQYHQSHPGGGDPPEG